MTTVKTRHNLKCRRKILVDVARSRMHGIGRQEFKREISMAPEKIQKSVDEASIMLQIVYYVCHGLARSRHPAHALYADALIITV